MINERKNAVRATVERLPESGQDGTVGKPAARIGKFTSLADRVAPYLDKDGDVR